MALDYHTSQSSGVRLEEKKSFNYTGNSQLFTCLSTTHTSCTCHCDWCHLIMILPIRVYNNRRTAAKWPMCTVTINDVNRLKSRRSSENYNTSCLLYKFFSASCYTIEIEIEKSLITRSSRACKHIHWLYICLAIIALSRIK